MTGATSVTVTDVTSTGPAPAVLGAGAWRSTAVFTGRSLRLGLRDVESMLMAILLPVMLMLTFTYVFGGAIDAGGDHRAYLAYVMPGIVLTCAGFGAAGTGVSVAQDMTTGTINRLRTMPIVSATVLLGHTLASLARNLIATALVVAVALAVGFRSPAPAWAWVAATGLVAAWILAITLIFAMLGLLASSPQAASGYGFVLLFLPYVSSAFAPVETMPEWLRGFAQHQPITPIVDSLRTLLGGGGLGTGSALALGYSTALAAIAIALIAVIFPRRVAR